MKEGGFAGFALRYASRSMLRNKRRTILTIGTVTLSVTVSIIGHRYSRAIMKIWEEGVINYGAGHAQFHKEGYLEHPDVLQEELTLEIGNPIETALASDPRVVRTARRLNFEGIISSGAKTIYFIGRAVEPDAELIVSPDLFNPESDVGSFVSSDDPTGIVVGKGLAETLDLSVGQEATLMVNTMAPAGKQGGGGVNGVDVIVRGIIDLPLPALSKRLIWVHFDQGQTALEADGRYSELAVRLTEDTNVERWIAEKAPLAKEAQASLRGWWDADPYIKDVERIWNQIVGIVIFMLFISAGISVLNIVYMLVAERTVEIGTLMAIGAKSHDIRRLFTLEATLFGLVGGALGAIIGNVVVMILDWRGVEIDSPFGSGVFLLHPEVSLGTTLVVVGGALAICYFSAIAPSRKAARVEPVIAFRGQIT